MAEYESVLLVKSEVFVYRIPPRTSNRGYRATEWNLDNPDWTGRMRLVSKAKSCFIKLEDKISGALFAQCPIETYPGIAVEPVADSSRYFVLRIQDDNGRNAFIGVGFADRSDSFDLNVALQDHFKWLQKEQDIEKEKEAPKPSLDLGFKEGETIKINMKITKKDGGDSASKTRAKSAGSLGGILPPPPVTPHGVPKPPSHRGTPASVPDSLQGPPTQRTPTSSPSHSVNTTADATPSSANNTDWVQF